MSGIEKLSKKCGFEIFEECESIINKYLKDIEDVNDKLKFMKYLNQYEGKAHVNPYEAAYNKIFYHDIVEDSCEYCHKCGEFRKKEDFKYFSKIETFQECTYRDPFDADGDTYEEVTKLVTYRSCPCGCCFVVGKKDVEENDEEKSN